ncbi:MAG: DNA polymerase III subunit alpha [Desulfobacca sp.]|uniref:DNA polymerase III subunit alpha n=1 Tax=Desulfobacca sp. TaxID=2067990 RepID=UPI00404A1FE7
MPLADFVHLHVHTAYSLLDGAIRLADLINTAAALEMPAVAITDHGTMFGVMELYTKARKAGIKPILGCEVYVAPGSRLDKSAKAKGENHHLVLLAENYTGYQNLLRLVSKGHLEGFYYKPRIDRELLADHREGLIALSACLHGAVASHILADNLPGAEAAAREYAELFPRSFYLEVQANDLAEQHKVNAALLELGPRWGLPLVATNDCHYLRPEDAQAHDVLLCIQTGKTIHSAKRMRFQTDQLYFKSPAAMAAAFPGRPDLLARSLEIAQRCQVELPLGEFHFPVFPLQAGQTMDEELRRQARTGLERRLAQLGQTRPQTAGQQEAYRQRLEEELNLLCQMGFAGYFLVVADFIHYARQHGIPVGPGRGSAAGSLVAYALEITDLDPIAYNLLFERFLNPERKSMPDIDVDFCFERRGEMLDYVAKKYGKDHVAQITTFGSLKTRQVIRDVGRALDLPYPEVDKIAKLVPDVLKIDLATALEKEPRLRELRDKDETVREVLTIAAALEGLPRHASTHAAGVVIADRPLWEYLPLYKGNKDEVVTQFDMKGVEQVGLVKFDFLGLRTLTVLENAAQLIRQTKEKDFDYRRLPLDDQPTFDLLCSGNTAGVFQLESSGMREKLVQLQPTCFEDLIALVALYRPGPLESGMVDDFIKRKHGELRVTYDLPELEPILQETYGIILYQEQVMQIAGVISGYSMGEADILRRAMGKKEPAVMAAQKERFVNGAVQRGTPAAKAEALFHLIEKFAGYGFNKSHSAAYAYITYQTAYVKAHYPLEFLAALFTSEINNPTTLSKHIQEAREDGVVLLPPCINASERVFTVEGQQLRFGLAGVKNVGETAIRAILEARKRGPFSSFSNFLERLQQTRVNKKVIEALIQAGAFDSLGISRARLWHGLETALERAQTRIRQRQAKQMDIFGGLGLADAQDGDDWLPQVPDWDEQEKLAREKEALGIYLSGHPLAKFRQSLQILTDHTIPDLEEYAENGPVTIGGLVLAVKETMTKKGDRMAFVTLEDQLASIEVVVFNDIYQRAAGLLTPGQPILVRGSVSQEEKGTKLIAQDIRSLATESDKIPTAVHLHLSVEGLAEEGLRRLRDVLERHRGPIPAFLHFLAPPDQEEVLALPRELHLKPSASLVEEVNRLFPYPVLDG